MLFRESKVFYILLKQNSAEAWESKVFSMLLKQKIDPKRTCLKQNSLLVLSVGSVCWFHDLDCRSPTALNDKPKMAPTAVQEAGKNIAK